MNEFNLADTIHDTVDYMCRRAVELYDTEQFDSGSAILNEWTLADNNNLLTKHLQCDVCSIKERLLYATMDNEEFTYGEFTFIEDELPIDNN